MTDFGEGGSNSYSLVVVCILVVFFATLPFVFVGICIRRCPPGLWLVQLLVFVVSRLRATLRRLNPTRTVWR